MPPLLAAALIALAAMVVRGLSGFGSALIMMPVLVLVIEPRLALVSAALVESVIGVSLLYQVRPHVSVAYLKMLLPPSLLGILAGSAALLQFDSALLKRSLGVVVILFALRQVLSLRRPPHARARWHRLWGYAAAIASGVLGALFGTSGPPVVIFLENQLDSGVALRATLIAFFAALDTARFGGYALGGLVTPEVLLTGAVMLPAAFAGNWVGTHLHLRINERLFRAVVGGLLILAGVLLVVVQ